MKIMLNLQRPLHQLFKAFVLFGLLQLSGSLRAQQGTELPEPGSAVATVQESFSTGKVAVQTSTCFLPVYFNYRRRQLIYNGKRLDGAGFLRMCRSINDSAVQEQLARYDDLTAQKQKLSFGMIGAGFVGMASFGGALNTGSGQPEANIMLAFTAVICIVAVPVMGIYTTVPHQKRKAVLFRDLPIVYNAYVEAQYADGDCK
jgi:hypothetical protein